MGLDDLSPAQRRIADALGTLVAPPSAEARARLLVAMRSAPAAPPVARPRFLPGWRRLALVSSAALLVLGFGAGGTLALTAHALPGSPAYSIRLAGEHLRLRIAGAADAGRLRVTFARERVEEARTAAHGDRAVIETLLRDSTAYLGEVRHDLHEGRVDQAMQSQLEREIGEVQTQERAVEGQYGIQGADGPQGPAGHQSPGGIDGAGNEAGATVAPSGAGGAGDAAGIQQQGGPSGTSGSGAAPQATASGDGQHSSGTGNGSDQATPASNNAAG